MKAYIVTVQAKVTKMLRVEVEENEEVEEVAYEMFDILNDGSPESFTQEILDIKEIA